MSAPAIVFAIPGDITTQTGGYLYDRQLLAGLRARGYPVVHMELGASYPTPSLADAADAAAQLGGVAANSPVIIDGLALGALEPGVIAGMSAPVVALIHHPLAHEGGLEPGRRDFLLHTERTNLAAAAHVVVTSPHTASLLTAEYGVPEALITIAQPGIDPVVRVATHADPPLILSVGIQIPRKGHDVLLRALSKISDLPWQAVIAGSVLDETYGASLVALRDDQGLADRVRLAGRVSDGELAVLYSQATVFALATRFEGYGMVFGEAMTYGLPIVSSRTGAVPDTVARGAGVLVGPDDPEEFARALRHVLSDRDARAALARESARAGALLAGWGETAALVGAVLDRLGTGPSAHPGPGEDSDE